MRKIPGNIKTLKMSSIKSQLVLIVSLLVLLLVVFTATMFIWNLTMPVIFGLPKISLIDTAIIYVLINLFRFNYVRAYINLTDTKIQNMEKGLRKMKEDQRK